MKPMRFPAAVLLALAISAAVTAANALPASLRLAKENLSKIRDYSVDAVLTVDSPQAHVKNMKYKVYFKRPDRLRVKAKEGFALLPKENMALGDPVRDILSKYTITTVGRAKLNGFDTEVLKAVPKLEDPNTPAMTLWVDARRGLILRSKAKSITGGSMLANLSYALIDGKYWMPSRMTAETTGFKQPADPKEERHHRFRRIAPVNGKLTLEFSNYKINKGISDQVFRQAQPGR